VIRVGEGGKHFSIFLGGGSKGKIPPLENIENKGEDEEKINIREFQKGRPMAKILRKNEALS